MEDLVGVTIFTPLKKQLKNKVDGFSSPKAVHDIELIVHEYFLALRCCTKS